MDPAEAIRRAAALLDTLGENVRLSVRLADETVPYRLYMVQLRVPGVRDEIYGSGSQPDTAYFDALNRRDEVLGARKAA